MIAYITKQQYLDWINSKTENFKYFTPAPEIDPENDPRKQFPILAMGVRAEHSETLAYSKSEFKNINDAGFNVILGNWLSKNKDILGPSLQNAKASKVKLLFKNWGFQDDEEDEGNYSKLMSVIDDEKNRPGFGGNSTLRDEPTYVEIIGEDGTNPNGTLSEDSLWKEYYYMMKPDPDYLVYINLVAAGDRLDGAPGANEDERFENYLRKFQEYFKPSLFSYDIYPISEVSNLIYQGVPDMLRNDPEGKIIFNYEDWFYKRLETVSNMSKAVNRPFYAFCLGISLMHFNSSDKSIRGIALEQYLRFEAFSALAYGAKGIIYWRYATPPNSDTESYFSALLNRNNDKTATWHYAQKVNAEIQKYSDIFLNGTVQYVGRTNNYNFMVSLLKNISITANTINATSERDTDGRFLISNITVGNQTYLLVVNSSPFDYLSIIIFTKEVSVLELTPITSTGEGNLYLASGYNTRILPPGGYRIFRIDN